MNRLRVAGSKPAVLPGEESEAHFFKEHAWGFGRSRGGRLISYRVEHPVWEVWPVEKLEMRWDWAGVYGKEWGFLGGMEAGSAVLARGSEVKVFGRE